MGEAAKGASILPAYNVGKQAAKKSFLFQK
jgi:hypothetical protein